MQVRCINDGWIRSPKAEGHPGPKVGDVDLVTDTKSTVYGEFYTLDRFGKDGFRSDHFEIVDAPDERAILSKRHDEQAVRGDRDFDRIVRDLAFDF